MSEQPAKAWSDNPNAPRIVSYLYHKDKASFAGTFIDALLYGVVIALFFQCMSALLNPLDRTRRSIKWGLVAHTVAMFSFATIYVGMGLHIQSICYIDDRDYDQDGPVAYEIVLYRTAVTLVANTLVLVNVWLADALLLYRCFIIYAMNHWVIAVPCLMYLASVAMGITLIYQVSQPVDSWDSFNPGTPFYAISLSLNVLLTLLIATRLILHSRDIRGALGPLVRADRLYTTLVTILVESSALYAANSLLYLGSWYVRWSVLPGVFLKPLSMTQVIAPFLITIRVANWTALTSRDVSIGDITGSIHFNGQGGSTNGNGASADSGDPEISREVGGETPAEHGVRDRNAIEQVPI